MAEGSIAGVAQRAGAEGAPKQMVYLVGGLALALASVLAGSVVADWIQPLALTYPDIRLVCIALMESAVECRSGAVQAGSVSVIGLSIAAALIVLLRPSRLNVAARDEFASRALPLALGGVLVLAVAFLATASSVPALSRQEDIARQSALVSIVNLGWPLLLQLAARAPDLRTRFGYLTGVVALLALTPYRATFLAAAAFGVVLPALETTLRARTSAVLSIRRLALGAAGIVAVAAITGLLIVRETAQRDLPLLAAAAPGESQRNLTALKLAQRLAYPVYQAHFAQTLADTVQLPSPADELRAKFRLSDRPNLNQYLYRRIYEVGSVGEMTSLYYGEAAAATSLAPIAWIAAAPLIYFLLWLLMGRLGVDVSVLAGLAIWRGSLGGFFSVAPAFAVQVGVVYLLARASSWIRK